MLLWWVALSLAPELRPGFTPSATPFAAIAAFAPGDLALLVPTSIAAAFGLSRDAAWAWTAAVFATGAAMYAAMYAISVPFLVGGGVVGALLMTPLLIAPPAVLWLVRKSRRK